MIKRLAKTLLPSPVWLRARYIREMAQKQHREFIKSVEQLGFTASARIFLSSWFSWTTVLEKPRSPRLRCIRIPGYQHPLYYREGTSDLDVIRGVFIGRDYECVANEKDVSLIIDCGANIGCVSYYFLHRYPHAHLIAIEPDLGNITVCQRNLRPFKDRISLVRAGVWADAVPLRVEKGNYRDGRDWSCQARPVTEGEQPDFIGVTIGQLLEMVRSSRVDILKMDIEAAEREVFAKNYQSWLKRTRNLVIELHGEDCESVFFRAMADFRWEPQRSGELTVCRNIRTLPDNQ